MINKRILLIITTVLITLLILFASYALGNFIMDGNVFPDTNILKQVLASMFGFIILVVIVIITFTVHFFITS